MNGALPPATEKITEAVIGAAFEVSRLMGHGFLEAVYRRSLGHELGLRGLKWREEVAYHLAYKGNPVGTYVADLLVEDTVIVELKAVDALNPQHRASPELSQGSRPYGRPSAQFRQAETGSEKGAAMTRPCSSVFIRVLPLLGGRS